MSLSIKKKAIKKAVSVVTTIATVVCMSGVASFSVTSLAIADVVDGALIKSNATNPDGTPSLSSLDVYIVKLVGTKKFKRLVLNPTVFNSYGHLNWGDIQTVSQSVMDEYTTSALVRVDTDPDEKVYALAPENDTGKKSWVNVTAAEFLGVAGSEDGDSIYTINSTDAGSYVATGNVTTVAQLETFYSAGTLPDAPAVTSGLTVALSANTPAVGTTLGSTDAFLFTKANFTATDGDVVVTGLGLKRTGLGASADFTKVWLVVDGQRRGSMKSINTLDEASLLFSTETTKVTVADGTSKTFEIWAQMAGGTAGHSNALGITSVSTGSAVSGLPVTGNAMSVSSVAAPAVTIIHSTIGSTADIGETGKEVAKFKLTNGSASETAIFEGIVLKSIAPAAGTRIDTDDVVNYTLYDNTGNVVAGPVNMSSDNYVRFTLDTPFEIAAGTSKFEWFSVKADVTDGPGRKIRLDVEYDADVTVYGGTNLAHSNVTDSYTSQTVTISASDLSISVDQTLNPVARDVVENTTLTLLNANLAAVKGAVTSTAMRVDLTGADIDINTTVAEFDYLRVYVDDLLVSETSSFYSDTTCATPATNGHATLYACFTDTFSVDGTVPVRVEIDLNDLDSTTATNIKAAITGSTLTTTRDVDGVTVTPTGTATGNTATVVVPGYKIYRSATPVSVTKVLGSQDVQFLGLDIKSNNTSNVVVNKLKVRLSAREVAGGNAFVASQNDVQQVELLDYAGNVIAGPEDLDSSLDVEFDGLALDVDSNGVKVIIRGDINSTMGYAGYDATDTLFFIAMSSEGTSNNNTYYAYDDDSIIDGTAGDEANAVATRIEISLANTGTLTTTLSNDTANSSQLVALSTDNTLASWKLVAANEDIQVKKFRVGLTTGPAGEDEISRIGLYEGTTKLAETYSFSGGYTEFDITSENFVVTSGSGNARYLTMKVDMTSTTDTVLDSGEIVAGVLIDLEAWGAINEVAPISGSTTNGFAQLATSPAMTSTGTQAAGITNFVVDASSGVLAGDIVQIASEQMYITSVTDGTHIIVIRGFNGTVAVSQVSALMTVARSLEGNNHKAYGAKIVITEGGLASGSFSAWGSYTAAYKFTITPVTGSVEEAILNSVKISMAQSSGIGPITVASADWHVTDMALYNGAGTLISAWTGKGIATSGACVAVDGLCAAGEWVAFDRLAVTANKDVAATADLDEAISASGETYTIKVKIGGGVTTGDTLQLQIADLGTISAAGGVDWDDGVLSAITWVGDEVNASVVGPQFKN